MTDEIISIWKPKNITSYDIVKRIQKIKKSKQVGHCGTLDPFAEGILIICTGKQTKNVNKYMDTLKSYEAEIYLGCETDTLDIEGQPIRISKTKSLTKKTILDKLSSFEGIQQQIPPYFCAKKIHGVKMYKLARRDIFIKRKPNKIFVKSINFLNFKNDILTINVTCGKGTYIRSLARDIASSLGTYGHLLSLKRFQVGDFNKSNSKTIDELEHA